jgi:hypothetical protein
LAPAATGWGWVTETWIEALADWATAWLGTNKNALMATAREKRNIIYLSNGDGSAAAIMCQAIKSSIAT